MSCFWHPTSSGICRKDWRWNIRLLERRNPRTPQELLLALWRVLSRWGFGLSDISNTPRQTPIAEPAPTSRTNRTSSTLHLRPYPFPCSIQWTEYRQALICLVSGVVWITDGIFHDFRTGMGSSRTKILGSTSIRYVDPPSLVSGTYSMFWSSSESPYILLGS